MPISMPASPAHLSARNSSPRSDTQSIDNMAASAALQSPFLLLDSHSTHRSKTRSSQSSRTRHSNAPRSPKRLRHHGSRDFQLQSGCTAFEDLPWISALDAEPRAATTSDIADLSLLDVNDLDCLNAGPGPIRTRKTSLRSNPLSPSGSTSDSKDSFCLVSPGQLSSPRTPRSRILDMRDTLVQFRNLMPVLGTEPNCDIRGLLPSHFSG